MSYQFLSKKGPTYAFLLAVVAIAASLIPIIIGFNAFDSLPVAQQASSEQGNIFLIGLYLTVALMVLAVAAAVLLSLLQVITDPKGALKGLIIFGIIAALLIIFYTVSDAKGSGSLAETIQKFEISDSISKIIGAGIRLTILLGLGSFFLIVVMEIWNYFKNQ